MCVYVCVCVHVCMCAHVAQSMKLKAQLAKHVAPGWEVPGSVESDHSAPGPAGHIR